MIIATYIEKIQNTVKEVEGKLDYDKWHVCFSCKRLNQFKFDTQIAMKHVIEIGKVDEDSIEELQNAFEDMGVDCIVEDEPVAIYLYKTSI